MTLTRTDVGEWASSSSHGTGSFLTGSFTPPANSLLIIVVTMMGNSTVGDLGQPTISGGSLTYTYRGEADGSTSWSTRVNIFTAPVGSSPSSMTITVDDDNNQDIYTYAIAVVAFAGYDSTTPIAGLVSSASVDIGDGSESQTLSATPTTNDVTLLVVSLDADTAPSNPTLASGWTKIYDTAVPGGGAGLVIARRESDTSTTVSVTDVYTAAGRFYKGSMISFIVKAADTGITGTLSKTFGALASSGSGAVAVSGSFAKTLSATTATTASDEPITALIQKTLASLSAAGVSNIAVTASLSTTLAALLLIGAGDVSVSSTAGVLLGSLQVSTSGTVDISSLLGVTLGLSIASSGSVDVNGTMAQTISALIASSNAEIPVTASLLNTLGALLLTASGISVSGITGSLSATLASLVFSSGAAVALSTSLLQTLGALIVSAAGSAQDVGGATLAATLADATLSASGSIDVSGIMAIVLNYLTSSGSVGVTVSATLLQTMGAVVSASAGNVSVTGTLQQVLSVLLISSAALASTGGFSRDGVITASLRRNIQAKGEAYTLTIRRNTNAADDVKKADRRN